MRIHSAIVMVLFLASAFAGALISYVPSVAWSRFVLIVVGVVLYIAFSILPDQIEIGQSRQMPLLRYILAVLPAIVVIYFVLTNDWTVRLGKLNWLDPVLRALSQLNVILPGLRLDSNSFGGVLATLVPLQIVALGDNPKRWNWISIILLAISAIGLLLSESRGAWIALGVVVGVAVLWKLSGLVAQRWMAEKKRQTRITISVSVLVLVALVDTLVALTPFGQSLIQRRSDRLTVWQNSLELVSDYPFTGLGLGGFDMAYSSYVLLLHVSHTIHAHNLYLDVWLEQGLVGLIAFVSLIVISILPVIVSFVRGEQVLLLQRAAFVSLGVILLHGMVDDPFYGYGGNTIPFLFVPFGLLGRPKPVFGTSLSRKLQTRSVLIFVGSALALVIVTTLLPGIRATFAANMGALSQTRAELSVYSWPTWPIQDELRRSNKIDLAPAIAQYQNALAIDPHNATANRRLGQIELSRGEYNAAQEHLEAAYAVAPDQRATRQMLGESYAIRDKLDEAVALWKNIDVSDGQLEIRQWWYEHIGEQKRAALIKQAASCCGG